jgi:N-acylneuraminate cytidylyltransferase
MLWPENNDKRSQEFPEAYHDAGQFYWGHSRRFLQEMQLFSADAVPVVIPRLFAQDIDTLEDWESAELMYRLLRSGTSSDVAS